MRDWRQTAERAAPLLTAALRAPGGLQQLRPIQAAALAEAYELEGLFLGARVGGGKTGVAGLLPLLLALKGKVRVLILTSGGMLEETQREFSKMRANWRVVVQYEIKSYTWLALDAQENYLDQTRPDIVICDEADALRRKNTCHKKLKRHKAAHPECVMVFMSGSFMQDSLLDYAPMLELSLGQRSPLPLDPLEVELWSEALDQAEPLALRTLAQKYGAPEDWEAACLWFAKRLRGTPGVILSDDCYSGSELEVCVHYADPGHDAEFRRSRLNWERPDGWSLCDQAETSGEQKQSDSWEDSFAASGSVWALNRQMALDFFYTCDPFPPRAWLSARREYFRFVRACIEAGAFFTEFQVRKACEAAAQPPQEFLDWKRLEPSFVPNRKPVWLSQKPASIEFAKAWGSAAPGIIWAEHRAWGERLAAETGWRFFREKGLDANRQKIDQAKPTQSIIAARPPNYRGRNLQYNWHRNLAVCQLSSALQLEQKFGRTFRDGQPEKQVHFTLYHSCLESETSLHSVFRRATHVNRTLLLPQIILNARLRVHGERPNSPAWQARPTPDPGTEP